MSTGSAMSGATPSERDRHLFDSGPKRILSLDGGGVRGIISLSFLERIEEILRARHGPRFSLCEYFDLIGGTSTGSIIATGLAMGMNVGELIEVYLELSREGFRGSRWHGGIFVPKFRTGPLLDVLRRYVGQEALGSEKIRTGLAVVAKRIDTGSTWIFHNNPRGLYFDIGGRTSGAVANKDLSLLQIVRASTAAPTFFAPERIEIAPGMRGTFVDGGASPYNNPALRLLMLATLKGYGFLWPCGRERILLLSVGTGFKPITRGPPASSPSLTLAVLALRSIIDDGNWLSQTVLQWLGHTPTPWAIDGEIGDLGDDSLTDQPLLHYLRYDVVLERQWLSRTLGRDFTERELSKLSAMDRPEIVSTLLELGRGAAAIQISDEHLPAAFDVSAGAD